MKEVIAIIRPEKWLATREAINGLGIQEVFYQKILGRGQQKGLSYLIPVAKGGKAEISFLPKRMVAWVVKDEVVNSLIQTIIRLNQTGNHGDGKIFVRPLELFEEAASNSIASETKTSTMES